MSVLKIEVRVKPNSKKPSLTKGEDGIWVVAVKEPATEGKANDAICRAIAEELDIAPSKVRIVKGEKSKRKLLEVYD
ncbi:DUF167 domain-containing protein [Leptospira sarikeiensis]|uniref:DUF167 domain-containing protein n=1 Tax=Leptospira sarikeiensis TaxID=2484943 RepID=A0A4R9K8A0_9LEPT|nr:DUF167 domain-containing protein [Leptospira sarikeiensis]TGL61610.1 DUF167 domain-containing protein [Leptospira sarikeiensis]